MKVCLEQAFRDCLVPSLRLGMPNVGAAASLTRGRAAIEEHFQPLAGNEVLNSCNSTGLEYSHS
ncbi:MAG: hypothetical protein V7K35_00890 [Nostoc sp.]|uniref:hypothetical protein n=1 Tax=Nostoc sp. TaxID=1180 RepID=UPI002FF44C41